MASEQIAARTGDASTPIIPSLECNPESAHQLMHTLFHQLGAVLKEASTSTKYPLDSFHVAVCDNIRIRRGRLVQGER